MARAMGLASEGSAVLRTCVCFTRDTVGSPHCKRHPRPRLPRLVPYWGGGVDHLNETLYILLLSYYSSHYGKRVTPPSPQRALKFEP